MGSSLLVIYSGEVSTFYAEMFYQERNLQKWVPPFLPISIALWDIQTPFFRFPKILNFFACLLVKLRSGHPSAFVSMLGLFIVIILLFIFPVFL